MEKIRFEKDFKEYEEKLKGSLSDDKVNLMMFAYCMGYCDMVGHINEDTDGMYLIDPVLEKILELTPLISNQFKTN